MYAQAGQRMCGSQTPKTGCLASIPILYHDIIAVQNKMKSESNIQMLVRQIYYMKAD